MLILEGYKILSTMIVYVYIGISCRSNKTLQVNVPAKCNVKICVKRANLI